MSLSSATSEALGILVADSNRMQAQLLSTALRRHPEFHVHTCAMDAVSIEQSVAAESPRVSAAVLRIFGRNCGAAVAVLRQFHLAYPAIAKVLLVDATEREVVISAFRSGARGIFSLTDASLRLLCKCILRVSEGQIWANTEQLNYIMDLITEVPSLRVLNSKGRRLLTPREEQVVALVAEGLSNRQVAAELSLSEHTIKKYLFRVFEKLGISTRVELVLYALNNGDARRAEWLIGSSHSALLG